MYQVGIIDIGIGNIFSLCQAIQHIGAQPIVIDSPVPHNKFDKLILPGVGNFSYAMARFQSCHFDTWIKEAVALEKPLLGICLGMQLLFSSGQEGKTEVPGLAFFSGKTVKIDLPDQKIRKLPNMGWRNVFNPHTRQEEKFYFMHSYRVLSEEKFDEKIYSTYCNVEILSIIMKNRLCGVQFHPEKSGQFGLSFLEGFITSV